MVNREVDWPVWVVLGRSWGLCVRSWAALGAYVGDLGRSLGLFGRSWAVLGLCCRSLAATGRKVAQARAGAEPRATRSEAMAKAPERKSYAILPVYIYIYN